MDIKAFKMDGLGNDFVIIDNRQKITNLTKEQIIKKQKQLENVTFINSAEWYQQKLLSLGFTVTVMDADWCFTTFLCKK